MQTKTMEEDEVDEATLADRDQASLPEPMKTMTDQQKKDYIAEKQREQVATAPSMNDALTGAIRKQAEQKHFVFEK